MCRPTPKKKFYKMSSYHNAVFYCPPDTRRIADPLYDPR